MDLPNPQTTPVEGLAQIYAEHMNELEAIAFWTTAVKRKIVLEIQRTRQPIMTDRGRLYVSLGGLAIESPQVAALPAAEAPADG